MWPSTCTYGTVQLVQNKTLTSQEIATLRLQDQPLDNLLNQALSLGFQFYNVGQQVAFNDGTTLVRLVLFDFADFAPMFLTAPAVAPTSRKFKRTSTLSSIPMAA